MADDMPTVLAIGCETITSTSNPDTKKLARVTIVDQYEEIVLDEYVKPTFKVSNFGSCSREDKRSYLINGSDFSDVRNKVADVIDDCVVVGYKPFTILRYLDVFHPEDKLRDLAVYEPFVRDNNGQPVPLEYLAQHYLRIILDMEGEYCNSVAIAKTCMKLYNLFPIGW